LNDGVSASRRLAVGRVDRAHGLTGDLVVTLTTNRLERVVPGAVVYTADDRALVVESSTPLHHRFIVRFVGVGERAAADRLHGEELFADPIDDEDELWVHDLIHAVVVDQLGVERGRVIEIAINPASDLLVLDSGALVPVRFLVDYEPNVRVTVDTPEGLFD
jgi:16S rRNA processing protein RimM